jgi:hypothetical protein
MGSRPRLMRIYSLENQDLWGVGGGGRGDGGWGLGAEDEGIRDNVKHIK